MLRHDVNFEKLEALARLAVPQLLLAVLFLFCVLPLPGMPSGALKPQFMMMAVYYWAIYRPTLLPPLACFIAGLLLDMLLGTPPGINALVLVMIHWLVREQRRFLMGQSYGTIWAVFALIAFLSVAAQWFMSGLSLLDWSPLLPALAGGMVTVFLFPVVTLMLVAVHRMLPVASRPYP